MDELRRKRDRSGSRAPDQRAGKISRGPHILVGMPKLLDEDLIMGAVPISISASRTYSGVVLETENVFIYF